MTKYETQNIDRFTIFFFFHFFDFFQKKVIMPNGLFKSPRDRCGYAENKDIGVTHKLPYCLIKHDVYMHFPVKFSNGAPDKKIACVNFVIVLIK